MTGDALLATGDALLAIGDALLATGDALLVAVMTGMGLLRSVHALCVHQQAGAMHLGGATCVAVRNVAVG